MRIGLFATCLGDTMFPDAVSATAVLLTRLGHEVVFPPGQTCCGQMHVNTGYQREPVPLVRNFAEQFGDPSLDAVVMPSGSCAGSVRHQHEIVAERYGDAALRQGVATVKAKTYELSELLVDVLGVTGVGAWFPYRVTYHPTCHSLRMLRVGEKPLRLLRAVEDLDLVELPEADACCGFGGTFAVKNADTSSAMLQDKVGNVTATGADVCTAGDFSCLLHIGGGLSRVRAGTRTLHLAQILASTRTTPYVLPGVPPTARATPTSPRASTTPAATTPEVTR
ncbi:(Fe-S)-binding protein [Streptomyces evansiae]|uniref:(Fe-S)-binding protein n=1 Tax=Streptomyces evansiae TaxID=3075535 RepID=UPI00288740E3|nr:(Fe-S)-binding protein [Streptomyces sp. DSM 41859]MDT0425697.1 (Fe-S)-binding protein [Streptomyces sp. DSM 41859]